MSAGPGLDGMSPSAYVVTHTHRESADTVTLAMEPADGRTEPMSWTPGQFTMLYAFGVGEIPVSISGDTACDGPLVHTVRDVGPVSHAIASLERGQSLGVRGPFGRGWRDSGRADTDDLLIVAGGLGLAPVRPLIYNAAAWRAAYRRATVLIGAREPAELIYRHDYDTWRGFDLEVVETVDRPDEAWTGRVGLVTKPLTELVRDPCHVTAFVCGPEAMMTATAETLIALGVRASAIRVSLERSMKCGIGVCGHCQLGPVLICRDGPCLDYAEARDLLAVKEL